jgi:hypothetical protein
MSITADYLLPTGPQPIDDDALNDALVAAVVGITGLPGNLVRPRWQAQPPQQPDNMVNWCAAGITDNQNVDYTYIKLNSDQLGSTQYRQQELSFLCSFYGPSSVGNANMLADGIEIPNNMWGLNAIGVKLIGSNQPTRIPDLTNAQWINRCDVTIRFRRETSRIYGIPSVLSSSGTLDGDDNGVEPPVHSVFDVEP